MISAMAAFSRLSDAIPFPIDAVFTRIPSKKQPQSG
jgi:hypothetical protein